ncbi:helitron helicase-like domain-containing protein [Artemisia annua]|uniref:Helitron helicase-like domain-containing protein n=1 Tax=Artemisia annua TaxID=35608 RepID=A0A2U1L362_ARTAN|nr:helitron helicase-like domain-containing protein [Artemisia annua]
MPRRQRRRRAMPNRRRASRQGLCHVSGLQILTYIWDNATSCAIIAMPASGAEIDDSVNIGRGPYVFKISGQIYLWIGAMCPEQDKRPKFLQLYIYDTHNEVANRLENFQRTGQGLCVDIVEDLIHFLDEHNELVQLFRTARDKMAGANISKFTIHLFGVVDSRQHELPSGDSIGAIIFEGGQEVNTDFDVIIQQFNGIPKRINKLHPSYMSLHFPLIFIYGEDGYHLGRTLVDARSSASDPPKKMLMKMFYAHQIHDRLNQYSLLKRSGGQEVNTDFDVIIERFNGIPKRINKLHPSYMSLHFPLIFIYGEDGYHLGRTLVDARSSASDPPKKMLMKMFYAHQIHDRLNQYSLLKRSETQSLLDM